MDEVAAIGIPDEKSGEIVKIFVTAKDKSLKEDELCDFNHYFTQLLIHNINGNILNGFQYHLYFCIPKLKFRRRQLDDKWAIIETVVNWYHYLGSLLIPWIEMEEQVCSMLTKDNRSWWQSYYHSIDLPV